MGFLILLLGLSSAALLWTATLTAAAVRLPAVRRVLAALGIIAPWLWLAPLVALAVALQGAGKLGDNWAILLGLPMIAALVAVGGGVSILWMGLTGRSGPRGAGWPLWWRAGGFIGALLITGTTLAVLDLERRQWAPVLRAEVAGIMQAVVLPPVADQVNAAVSYRQACQRLEPDSAAAELLDGLLTAIESDPHRKPLGKPLPGDDGGVSEKPPAQRDDLDDFLLRQGVALAYLRRAADMQDCRFDRDWSRPSISMLLPEIQSMRLAARALAIAARREGSRGQVRAGLEDVERLQRMAGHVAAEPLLISVLVGCAIDSLALRTLASLLPRLTDVADLDQIDSLQVADGTRFRHALSRALHGEQGWILCTAADLADGRTNLGSLGALTAADTAAQRSVSQLLGLLYRVFLLPSDLASVRRFLAAYQEVATPTAEHHLAAVRRLVEVENARLTPAPGKAGPGILASLLMPAIPGILEVGFRNEAEHRLAEVLVAATRYRLVRGHLPEHLSDLVPEFIPAIPADPFTATMHPASKGPPSFEPVRLVITPEAWTVYSVGPNGRDEGGRTGSAGDGRGAVPTEIRDDITLPMRRSRGVGTEPQAPPQPQAE